MTLHDKPLFVAPNKVQDYLLNPDHPVGGAKARFSQVSGIRGSTTSSC